MVKTNSEDESPFDVIERGDEETCRALWLSTILQAILDGRGKFGNAVTQAQARVWLEGREGIESDFATVCMLASVDFKTMRRRCAELLKDDAERIDFRSKKPDLEKNRTAQNRKRYFKRASKNAEIRLQRKQVQLDAILNLGLMNHDNDDVPYQDNDNFINQQ